MQGQTSVCSCFIVIDETPSELYNGDKVQQLLKITIGGCHEIR